VIAEVEHHDLAAEVIDCSTGEVTTADLVPADNMAALDALDPRSREVAVTRMLSEARSWLAHAVEATEPQTIVNFKAQMATIAEATKQLNLSKEIQVDALEMLRRAEIGVGTAIRKGQAEGTIGRHGQNGQGDYIRNGSIVRGGKVRDQDLTSPRDLAQRVTEAYERRADLALGYASWAEYATAEFKPAEGLAASVRQQVVGLLSAQGMSTRAIAPVVGVGQSQVRRDAQVSRDGSPDVGRIATRDGVVIAEAEHHDLRVNPETGRIVADALVAEADHQAGRQRVHPPRSRAGRSQ
jgi:hypothetical protein